VRDGDNGIHGLLRGLGLEVGAVGKRAFCSAVDDPARFSRCRAAGVRFGLTPRRYQTGETDRAGRISVQGDGPAHRSTP
jgi:transposase